MFSYFFFVLCNLLICWFVWQGKARKTIQAQKLWFAILEAQVETGNPYMLFKVCCQSLTMSYC